MDRIARQEADLLERMQRGLADLAVDELMAACPGMAEHYGTAGPRIWRAECASRLAHLVEAIAAGRPELFVGNAAWARAALLAREVPASDVRAHLEAIARVLRAELPPAAAARAAAIVDASLDAESAHDLDGSILDGGSGDATLARLFLMHLLQREADAATRLVMDAVRGGMSQADACARIVLPALGEVGRMWQVHEASVADEHYCTAAAQSVLARLRIESPRRPAHGRRALCCAVGGDMHEIGLRVVADLLEADGWQVEYLGANTPAGEVVGSLEPELPGGSPRFDLLVLSASTTLTVRATADVVDAVRAMPGGTTLPILVGGTPFRAVHDLWRVVGADGCARCVTEAVAQAHALVDARAR